MTSRAFLKYADLKRMAVLAKSENVAVEYEVDGVIVRVKPYEAPQEQDQPDKLPDDFAF